MENELFFEIDEYSNFIDNLEMTADFLNSTHPFKMKWVILSLHQTLYGLFLCALQGTDSRQTIVDRQNDSGRAVYLYANHVDIETIANTFNKSIDQIKKWICHPKIISFDTAFDRIQKQECLPGFSNAKPIMLTESEINYISSLSKNFRNEFEHFNPKGWVIEKSIFWPLIETCLKIIKFEIDESNCISLESDQKTKIHYLIADIEFSLRKEKKSEFRNSDNTFAISPIHNTKSFSNPLTIDEKIEIFIARVKGWQIQPAIDLQKKNVSNRGFAQLSIILSYLEMIGKYNEGYIGDWKSSEYFKKGLKLTFPEISENEEKMLKAFYSRIRNGLYHLGITCQNVMIYDNIPGSFGFNEDLDCLVISPDKFVNDISIRFYKFAAQLKNQQNTELRENFEKRFDYDNQIS